MKNIGLAFFVWMMLNSGFCQEVQYLPLDQVQYNNFGFTNKNPYLLHFTTSRAESADSLVSKLPQFFSPLNSLALNQGPSSMLHWIALPLENVDSVQQEVFFTLKNSAINCIRYYWVEDERIVWQGITGDNVIFSQRPYPFCNFTFPLTVQPFSRGVLMLELDKRNENFFCGFDLMKATDFRKFEVKTYWIFGIFTGIILITIAVNLFLFFSLRDRVHLWYGMYALSTMFLLLAYEGMDFQFIYPETPFISNVSRYLTTGTTYILLFQLLVVFVKEGFVSGYTKWLIRGFQGAHLVLLFSTVITFGFFEDTEKMKIVLFRALSIISSLSLLTLLLLSWQEYRRGHKPSLLFFVAVLLLFIGSVEYVLNINGLYTGVYLFPTAIPSNMQICLVAEAVMVFFAIFYRYKVYRNERMQLKYKLLEAEVNWRDQQFQSIVNERSRIAMDIHDGIGSRLFGTRLKLDGVIRTHDLNASSFEEVSSELMLISKELKNVIWSLTHRETSAEEQMRHLEALLIEMFLNVPSECKIDFDLGDAILKIEFLMDLQLMLLEMASNFIKHSSSTQARVKVYKMGNQVVLHWMEESPEIKTQKGSGLGLMSIQNRYEKWKGKREKKDAAFDYCIFFEANEISA